MRGVKFENNEAFQTLLVILVHKKLHVRTLGHDHTVPSRPKRKKSLSVFYLTRHLLIFSLHWKNVMVFRSHLSWIRIKSRRLRCKLVSYVLSSFPYLRLWARYVRYHDTQAEIFVFSFYCPSYNLRTAIQVSANRYRKLNLRSAELNFNNLFSYFRQIGSSTHWKFSCRQLETSPYVLRRGSKRNLRRLQELQKLEIAVFTFSTHRVWIWRLLLLVLLKNSLNEKFLNITDTL